MEQWWGRQFDDVPWCFLRLPSGSSIMTGYTVHTGSNDNFRSGWDEIFSDEKQKKKKPAKSAKKTGKTKARAKKSSGKKRR